MLELFKNTKKIFSVPDFTPESYGIVFIQPDTSPSKITDLLSSFVLCADRYNAELAGIARGESGRELIDNKINDFIMTISPNKRQKPARGENEKHNH
jgi:hypothetical protein